MKWLALNSGSGSQKCSLFDVGESLPDEPVEPIWTAKIEATSPGHSANELALTIQTPGKKDDKVLLQDSTPKKERL